MRLLFQKTNIDVLLIFCFRFHCLLEDSFILAWRFSVSNLKTMAEGTCFRRLLSSFIIKCRIIILFKHDNIIAHTEQITADVIIYTKRIRPIYKNIYILSCIRRFIFERFFCLRIIAMTNEFIFTIDFYHRIILIL